MEELISVIVPVYNVEKYLPECLDSILSQDHRQLQILLIDDGSTDTSGEICDRYAAEDSRFQVIHQKNAGAGAAKNAGLRQAVGQYLSFVDSDDYLEPNVYRYMLDRLEQTKTEAAQFAFRDVYRDHVQDHPIPPGPALLDNRSYLTRFPKDWTCSLLWNKLYRRALFDGVFFPEGRKIDDEFFTYRGFLQDCQVCRDPRIVYNYRRRTSSVMGSAAAAERRILDSLEAVAQRRQVVRQVYPELKKVFDENYLDAIWYLSENTGSTEATIAASKAALKAYLRTPGSSLPPRYLWKRLWNLYRTPTATLLEQSLDAEKEVEGYLNFFE